MPCHLRSTVADCVPDRDNAFALSFSSSQLWPRARCVWTLSCSQGVSARCPDMGYGTRLGRAELQTVAGHAMQAQMQAQKQKQK